MVTVKREYDTSRRRAQANATRRDVLEAAGRRFTARGFAATTIDEIAADAGVSRETIFKAYGTKRELLRKWVEREVAGPDEPVPIKDQAWVAQLRDERDRDRRIESVARATCRIHGRSAGAIGVLRAAAHADTEIAALWDEAQAQRRADVEMLIPLLAELGPVPPPREVADVVYALTSPELYDLFVRHSGWAPEQFEQWLMNALRALAFAPR